jgi:hypothetical protein
MMLLIGNDIMTQGESGEGINTMRVFQAIITVTAQGEILLPLMTNLPPISPKHPPEGFNSSQQEND